MFWEAKGPLRTFLELFEKSKSATRKAEIFRQEVKSRIKVPVVGSQAARDAHLAQLAEAYAKTRDALRVEQHEHAVHIHHTHIHTITKPSLFLLNAKERKISETIAPPRRIKSSHIREYVEREIL